MYVRIVFCAIVVFVAAFPARAEAPATPRQAYLSLAESAYQQGLETCPADVERWLKEWKPTVEWGYAPPASPIYLAGLAGSLYDLTKNEDYAEVAAHWLANQHRFKESCPEHVIKYRPEYGDGLPTMTDFFHLPVFAQAYLHIKDSPAVTAERRAHIEASIADSADYIRNFPEWGPMNRTMLRAQGLVLAAKALPDHPHAAFWRKLGDILARDSWGQWEEEDAQIYHPIWFLALMHYADAIADPSLYAQHQVRYYCDYFVHLLSPAGMVPDFGDARWNENWAGYLTCLERGAREYRSPQLKWGAQRIFDAMTEQYGSKIGLAAGLTLTYAYRWADDSITPAAPPARSEEVLEELIGKKIVFRNGWGPDSTYLLLNYRDEGPFARVARDFLRLTIPAEEERMHHAHSDENSICLFMNQGSVLLHDAGYRDTMPSGPYGAYRADYFHNRLVARNDKRDREQPLYEFLRNSGAYRSTQTEKIDFLTAPGAEMSRTRLTDQRTGYVADRVIVRLTKDDIFLVFDIAKVLRPEYYTFATLWHGTTLLGQGPHYYITAVDAIGKYSPPQTRALLVQFLQSGVRTDGTFPIKRYWQDETAVYQAISSHYRAGQVETFVTALVPHARGADVQPLLDSIKLLDVEKPRNGLGVQVQCGDEVHYICVKTDLDMDILPDNVRPRYSFDSGRVKYGPIETDASFAYARRSGDSLTYAAANMVKVIFDGRTVFAGRTATFALQPDDLSTGYGLPKWRYWEDTVDLSQPGPAAEAASRWP
jgi:hypothetical protein